MMARPITDEDPNEEIRRLLRRALELLEAEPLRVEVTLDGKAIQTSLLNIKRASGGRNLGLA